MALLIVALFVLLPLAELAVIIAAAHSFGLLVTFAALVLFSVGGAWLMRREGWALWGRANREFAAGRIPATELIDGVMVLGGGALLLTPGFITDAFGLLLMVPPVRALLRPVVLRSMRRRAARTSIIMVSSRLADPGFADWPSEASDRRSDSAEVIDIEANEAPGTRVTHGTPGDPRGLGPPA